MKFITAQPEGQPLLLQLLSLPNTASMIKAKRALSSKKDEDTSPLDEFPKDSDGSAKVALIGIDRSISAWGEMAGYFPEEKAVLRIIKALTRLGEMTEKEFPDARSFKRPGFDDDAEA